MERIEVQEPTAIWSVRIVLHYVEEPDEGRTQQGVDFEVRVADQTGAEAWVRRGDLAPYLDDTSAFLETADRAWLLDFMTRVRQEAAARILGG